MRFIHFSAIAAIAVCLGLASTAGFAQTAPVNIERFALTKPAASLAESATSIERTATLDGTQYAVVAPIFKQLNTGNYSFIRLENVISTPSTFTIKVVGSPSGNVYGTASIVVPAFASPQKSIDDIITAANAGALTGGDTDYALYISNPDLSGYQHVVYSYVSKFFENASLCQTSLSQSSIRYLANVHTKVIADSGFPATVFIHNYANQAVTYNVAVYSSTTGALIGTVPVATQANSTYSMPFSFFETQLNWVPTGSEGYASMIFTPATAIAGVTLPPVVVGNFIFNNQFQAYVNMSDVCAVNPGSASTGSTATAAKTTYAGTVAGVNIAGSAAISGTLSVSIPTGAATASAQLASTSSIEKSQATAAATGTLVIGGSTIALTGTYDTGTKAVSLTGGGFTFTGSVASGAFSGSYTGPGSAKGSFSALDTTQTLVTAYCGTFKDTPPDTNSGSFNLSVSVKGVVSGTYSGVEEAGSLSGTATSSTISAATSTGTAVHGTISGTKITGTYNDGTGSTGTFTGNKCALPAT